MCVKLANKTSGMFPAEKSSANKRHEAHNPKIQANAGYHETPGQTYLTSVHYTESILAVLPWNVKCICPKNK